MDTAMLDDDAIPASQDDFMDACSLDPLSLEVADLINSYMSKSKIFKCLERNMGAKRDSFWPL